MAVTVITGANSGIGRATAIHLARSGHTVYGTVRATAKVDKLLAMAEEAGVEIHLEQLDVADDDSVRTGFARILDATGGVDNLVNNGGGPRLRTPDPAGGAVPTKAPTPLVSRTE
jgi:NAD(P)-dependent dehydrogenase (short-subunit alcohol dehydrogenase family)